MKKKILLSVLCLGALNMSEPVKAGKQEKKDEITALNAKVKEMTDAFDSNAKKIEELSSENASLKGQLSSCSAPEQ